MRGGSQPGAGRPLKIKTPQEFEAKAMSVLRECEEDDGPIPTILYLEYRMGIPNFYDYLERPRFSDTASRIQKITQALYEQKASKGIVNPHIAKMKLAHERDYAPVVQEVEVKQETTVNYKLVDAIDARYETIQDRGDRRLYLENMKSMLREDESAEEA